MMLTEGNGTSSVFGDDLTQRGSYACSKVNLTGFHRNHPARVDGEEGIDFSGCHGFHERSCLTKRLRQVREEKPTISTPLALRTSWRDGRVHLTPIKLLWLRVGPHARCARASHSGKDC